MLGISLRPSSLRRGHHRPSAHDSLDPSLAKAGAVSAPNAWGGAWLKARLSFVSLLALLAVPSCGSENAMVLAVRPPPGVALAQYAITVQDRDTRQVVYQSGIQPLEGKAAARDLNSEPLRVGLKLGKATTYLVHVRAATTALRRPHNSSSGWSDRVQRPLPIAIGIPYGSRNIRGLRSAASAEGFFSPCQAKDPEAESSKARTPSRLAACTRGAAKIEATNKGQ